MENPEITLYDLACAKQEPFSPVVWRIRLMLNYKQIPYRTIFLEFQDIEPTLKALGIVPGEAAGGRYTVPVIHHIPSDTFLMDSIPISKFVESTYPHPPVPLTSELGREVETKARSVLGPPIRTSLTPREIHILSPPAQEFFRRTREAIFGQPLEKLLDEEDDAWKSIGEGLKQVSDLIQTNKVNGPFVLGSQPSYTDFFVAGALETARVIDEGTFRRFVEYPGFRSVYEACLPYINCKRD